MSDIEDELLAAMRALEPLVRDARVEARKGLYYYGKGEGRYCKFCGWCPHPGLCVRSMICPMCFAEPGEKCRPVSQATCIPGRDELGPLPFHDERWMVAASEQLRNGVERDKS